MLLRTFVVVASLILVIGGLILDCGPMEKLMIVLATLCFLVCAIPLYLQKNYRITDPLTFVMLVVFVGIPLKIFYIVAFHEDSQLVQTRLLMGGEPLVLFRGVYIALASMIIFVVGYMIRIPPMAFFRQSWVYRKTQWKPQFLTIGALLAIAAGAAFFFLFIDSTGAQINSFRDLSSKRFNDLESSTGSGSSQRLQSLSYYYYRLAYCARYVAYLLLAYWIAKGRRLFSFTGFLLALASFLAMAVPFFISNRAGIVIFLMDCGIIVFLLRQRIRLLPVVLAGLLTFAVLLLQLDNRKQAVGATQHNYMDLIEQTIAGRDFLDISKTGHIINGIPDLIPHLYGETLIGWIVAPFPKSLWPNRPMFIERGQYIATHIYGIDGVSGIPPGLVAEFYWNFGWVGIVFGFLVAGLFLRFVATTYRQLSTSINFVIIYGLAVTRLSIFSFGSDVGTSALKTLLDVIPVTILLLLVARLPRQNEEPLI